MVNPQVIIFHKKVYEIRYLVTNLQIINMATKAEKLN